VRDPRFQRLGSTYERIALSGAICLAGGCPAQVAVFVGRGSSLGEGVETPRLVETLQVTLTLVAEAGLSTENHVADGGRHEDGPVVGGVLDPGGKVDRCAGEVSVLAELDLAGAARSGSGRRAQREPAELN
jgi:hypothetical protein